MNAGIIKDYQYQWPVDAIDLLKANWGRYSGSQLCSMLPADHFGNLPTRNAVIDKANRLGLALAKGPRPPKVKIEGERRTSLNGLAVRRARERQREYRKLLAEGKVDAEPAPHVDDVARVSILELNQFTCRWPVGNPGQAGFGYCGNGVRGEGPYCSGHHARARGESRKAIFVPGEAAKPARRTFAAFERSGA